MAPGLPKPPTDGIASDVKKAPVLPNRPSGSIASDVKKEPVLPQPPPGGLASDVKKAPVLPKPPSDVKKAPILPQRPPSGVASKMKKAPVLPKPPISGISSDVKKAPVPRKDRYQVSPPKKNENTPVIISWNRLGGFQEYDITCSSLQCHVTRNHEARHNHNVLGIMFYGTDFGKDGLPLPRKPGHLWSVIHNESPKNNNWLFCAKDAMTMFNLTATFRRESHYPYPTMWLKDERDLTSTEFVLSVKKKNELRRQGLAPIVFVHSDCNTPSDRSHYMRLLQQYIQIDSYGKCEHNKNFSSGNLTFKDGMKPMLSADFYKLFAQYKFAFAFENAVCDDYITEKFWRPLHLGVVPLVFGSPKIKELAPSSHSIIDIRDFRSVKELADYITFLDTHDDEYSKYLDFKRTGIRNPILKSQLRKRNWGKGNSHDSIFSGFECFICEKLHKLKHQMTTGQPVEQWCGKHDHYGCPAPKVFDEEGNYGLNKSEWLQDYHFAKYYFKSLRHHIHNNINANNSVIYKLAQIFVGKENNNGKPSN